MPSSHNVIPTIDRKRRAAIEILINWGRISDLILKGAVMEIKKAMEKSKSIGA